MWLIALIWLVASWEEAQHWENLKYNRGYAMWRHLPCVKCEGEKHSRERYWCFQAEGINSQRFAFRNGHSDN